MLLTSSMDQDHPQNRDIQMIGDIITQLDNDLMDLTGVQTFESYNASPGPRTFRSVSRSQPTARLNDEPLFPDLIVYTVTPKRH